MNPRFLAAILYAWAVCTLAAALAAAALAVKDRQAVRPAAAISGTAVLVFAAAVLANAAADLW